MNRTLSICAGLGLWTMLLAGALPAQSAPPLPLGGDDVGRPASGGAQGSHPGGPRDYGTGSVNILQIPAAAFVPFNTTWTHDSAGYFFPTSSSLLAHAWAPVSLPSGSQINYIDVYYADTDATYDVGAKLLALTGTDNSAAASTIATVIAPTGTPGKGYAYSNSVTYTVDDDVNYHGGAQIVAQVTLPSTSTGFKGVDIWWTRQLSPAPATNTFADVPTNHPYFRVIEALAASGITTGCGGSNFCPDGVVTRKEIAKFLSRALGLYWNDSHLGPF